MENFIVSARKYRPATFGTVVGQASITNTLKNAIRSNQLAQAFLFCGPRGVGKTTCARILAKTINCKNINEQTEPCNQCESCLSFSRSASFNIYELDAASNNSVEDIRSLVDQVRIPPQAGKYKVYIIDEVHMLSLQAFNAFLKTLEEPPAYAKFILATTEKHKIIPTILSRCQIFDFKRISISDMVAHLEFVAASEDVRAEKDALHVIAVKADGSLRDALSIFDQLVSLAGSELKYKVVIENLNVLDYDYYFRITDSLLTGDLPASLVLLNEIISNGFDGQHFITGLCEHMRNLLISRDPRTRDLITVAESYLPAYASQAKTASAEFLFNSLETINKYDLNYKNASNKNLHLEICLLEICGLRPDEAGDASKKKHRTEPQPAQVAVKEAPRPAPPEPRPRSEENKNMVREQANFSKDLGTFSIKRQAETTPPVDATADPDQEPAADHMPPISFSEDELRLRWEAFADSVSSANPNLYVTLTRRTPLITGSHEITFEVDNKVQEEEIIHNRRPLLSYLREELHCAGLQLSVRVVRNAKDAKPYTPQERFKYMVQKNPNIKKLQEELDLDIDY